jgi:hypothetical protein
MGRNAATAGIEDMMLIGELKRERTGNDGADRIDAVTLCMQARRARELVFSLWPLASESDVGTSRRDGLGTSKVLRGSFGGAYRQQRAFNGCRL